MNPKFNLRVPETINEHDVDLAFFKGLGVLQDLKTDGEKIIRKQLRGVGGGLELLFDLSKERIVHGGTGRDRHLPQKVGEIRDCCEYEVGNLLRGFCVEDTDLAHTIACLSYAFPICESLRLDESSEKVVLSSLIVHDCAYPEVKSYDEFVKKENRKKHMSNAAKEFNGWSRLVNEKFSGFYSADEVEKVKKLVRCHDNPGFGEDYDYSVGENLVFVHGESDRLWMVNYAGFALDLLREVVEKQKYDPQARLDFVVSYHKNEQNFYKKNRESLKEFEGEPTLYRTNRGIGFFRDSVKRLKGDYHLR